MANSLGSLVVRLGLNAAEYTTGLTKASSQASQFASTTEQSMQRVQRAAERTNETLGYLKRGFAIVASAYGLQELKNLSDEYQNASARLSIFSVSQEDLARTLSALFGVAQTTRQSLSATVDLYYQLANATQDAGLAQSQLLSITSAVNKGLIISGSTGDSAKGVIIQLSQALAAGKLRGQEFNTVNEQGNRILRALAEGLGKTVGELREMANDGKITTDVFVQGFTKGIAGIDKDFEKLPVTITGGLTKVSNAVQQYIGTTFNAQRQSNLLAKSLDLVAKNFDLMVAAVTGFLTLKIANVVLTTANAFTTSVAAVTAETAATTANAAAKVEATTAKLAELAATRATIVAAREQTVADLAAIQASGVATAATRAKTAALIADLALLGRAQNAVNVQTVAANASLLALGAGTGFVARGMATASRAVSAVGGPIGAISLLLGIGATAWQFYATSAEKSAQKASEVTEASTTDILAALNKQIQKLKDLNKYAEAGYEVKTSLNPGAVERIFKLQERLAELKKKGDNVSAIEAIDVQANIDALNQGLETLSKEADKQAERGRAGKYSEWMLQYATDAERMAAEIQKARNELGDKFTPELEKRIKEKFTKKPPVDDPARKIMDGQIKAVEAQIAREKDLLTSYEGFLRDIYAEGLYSVNDYYDKLQGARDENLRSQLQAYDDEIVAAQIFYEHSKKEQDKQDALNKIEDIRSKRTNLLRDAGISEQALNRDRIKSNREFLDSLDEVNAKILELNGNTAAAARIRFDAANRILNNQIAATDTDAARRAQEQQAILAKQVSVVAELADKYKEYSLVIGEVELEQQRIAGLVSSTAMSELEGLYALSDANAKRLTQLKEIAQAYAVIAQQSKDPADILKAKQLAQAVDLLGQQTDLVAKKFNDIATTGFADALYEIATGAKTVGEAFKSMSKSIGDAIARIAANRLSEALFGKDNIGSGFGSLLSKIFSGSSLFGSSSGGGLPGLIGDFPSGGIGMAASGTDFWRGGATWVGENGPEIVSLPRGSQVIPNHEAVGMGHTINQTNNFIVNQPTSRAAQQQIAARVQDAVSRAARRR